MVNDTDPILKIIVYKGFFCKFQFQFVGIWMTARFRNQKNPRANPKNFL